MAIPNPQLPFARSISKRSARPTGDVVLESADHEPEDGVAVAGDGLVVASAPPRATDRRVAHEPADAVVGIPVGDEIGVVGLERAEIDALAAEAPQWSVVGHGRTAYGRLDRPCRVRAMRTAALAGPRRSSLVILLVAAAAMLATSPPIPHLDGHVEGEVALTGGVTETRQVRLHLDPAGGAGATDGSVTVGFVAANGLDDGYGIGTSLSIAREGSPSEGSAVSAPIPVDECVDGCDLDYVVTVTAGPDVLPGSTMRYRVDGLVRYGGGASFRDPALMQLDVDGRAGGPPSALWAVLAGLIGIALGVTLGAQATDSLATARRRWPALALAALPLVILVLTTVTRAIQAAEFLTSGGATVNLSIVGYIVDPWSTALLVTLAWGVIRGIRRRPDDGGWRLGLGAVALVGLGGLWLALVSTDGSVIQPWLYAAGAVAMGLLGGIVIGDAWRPGDLRTTA